MRTRLRKSRCCPTTRPRPAGPAAWRLRDLLGGWYGGSSGTHFVACLQLAARMRDAGQRGSIVTLLGDRGERYAQTLFDEAWLASRGIDLAGARAAVDAICDP